MTRADHRKHTYEHPSHKHPHTSRASLRLAPPTPHAYPCTAASLRLCCRREYYFSARNLRNDWYLRQRMDAHGFVYLTVVANFNRVKELTAAAPRVGAGAALDVVLHAARASPALELADGGRANSRTSMVRGWRGGTKGVVHAPLVGLLLPVAAYLTTACVCYWCPWRVPRSDSGTAGSSGW